MQKVKCEQGSPEWLAVKVGVASASGFDRLITAAMKPSSQADEYLAELIGEWVTGKKKYIKPTYWMERGTNMEPEARSAYELITDDEVEQVGFIYKDRTKLVGCSPDGLVGSKGIEIKCPEDIMHVAYLVLGVCPKKYLAQVQGSIWVTGLYEWDFMSYYPEYEPFLITVKRDPKFQDALSEIIPPFIKRLQEKRKDPQIIAMRERRIALEAAA